MRKISDGHAAELALGTLEGDASSAANLRSRHDAAFATNVEQWSQDFAALAEAVEEAYVPAGLLDSIETEIDRLENGPANTVTLRREKGEWLLLSEGVECKVLCSKKKPAARQ